MQRTIGRLGLGIVIGLALVAFSAAPALATTVTTAKASHTTSSTAVLNGVIDTGGVATAWQFQWGTTTSYGRSTPPQQIAAGKGVVSVSSTLTHLKPNTTYHFRLIATTGTGTSYYPLIVARGGDMTFTTKSSGRLLLVRRRLVVRSNFVSVPLRCSSGLKCHGRFTISTLARLQGTHSFADVLCATTFFTIGAHKTGAPRVRVRAACLSLLRASPRHIRPALVTSNPRTGQHRLITKAILVLG